jgi:hypothetical protein
MEYREEKVKEVLPKEGKELKNVISILLTLQLKTYLLYKVRSAKLDEKVPSHNNISCQHQKQCFSIRKISWVVRRAKFCAIFSGILAQRVWKIGGFYSTEKRPRMTESTEKCYLGVEHILKYQNLKNPCSIIIQSKRKMYGNIIIILETEISRISPGAFSYLKSV